jgi:HNH endonuclease
MKRLRGNKHGYAGAHYEAVALARIERLILRCPMSGCWLWTGSVRKRFNYGAFLYRGKYERAHRAMWLISGRTIPDGMQLLHKCDVPCCVNPDHLFLGTHLDNMRDMDAKGRRARLGGERNPHAILTNDQALQIRRLRAHGMKLKDIGAEFGVSINVVHRASTNRTYRVANASEQEFAEIAREMEKCE